MHPTEFEQAIFHAINGYAGVSWTLDLAMNELVNNKLIKDGLFIAAFVIFWVDVTCDQTRRHADLCFILIAVSLSLFVNRLVEIIFPFRPRPFNWTDIGMQEPTIDLTGIRIGAETLLMAIWSIACLLARVFLGYHFPADIVVGAVIGVVVTLAARREAILHILRTSVAWLEMRVFALFNAAFVSSRFSDGKFVRRIAQLG